MKKITLLLALVAMGFSATAQVELTYNTDDMVTGANSVGCPGGDNNWARNFLVDDFPTLPATFMIVSGVFGVQSSGAGDETVTVNVYASDSSFPASFGGATLVGSQNVVVPGGTASASIEYTFDTPPVIPAGTDAVIIEVSTELGEEFFIGGTANELADGYLRSENCGVTEYTTATDIGFPDAHFLISVIAMEVLGVNDTLLAGVSVYPNPATDVLNIKVPSNVELTGAVLYDILGKKTNTTLSNSAINIANLANGVYMLSIETTSGTLVEKVIVQ